MGKKNAVWLDKDKVTKAFQESSSIREVLDNLGEPKGATNYQAAKYYGMKYGLNLPEYDYSKNLSTLSKKRDLDEILQSGTKYSPQALKRRLIKEMGWKDKCSMDECPNPNPEWRGEKLTLQLDHIDGNRFNNKIENLRIICPNCHTQTPTFSNRRGSKFSKHNKCSCGNSSRSGRCRSCASKETLRESKIKWPSVETIIMSVKNKGYLRYSKELGVSDVAIRKHLLKNDVDPKTVKLNKFES